MSSYVPFTNAREEAITVIRARAQDIRDAARRACGGKVYNNFLAVAENLEDIANLAEGFEE